MGEKEEEVSTLLYKVSNKLLATEQLQKSKQDLEYCQRRTREVEEEVRVTNDGLLQVHGQDQVKLQVCLNVIDVTYNSAWLIVVLFTAE